jgi:ElaB/YqjD/DUF883 family membrane-anchored ribosome-binding protein
VPRFQDNAGNLRDLHVALNEIDETIEQDSTGMCCSQAESLDEIKSNIKNALKQLRGNLSNTMNWIPNRKENGML